MSHRLIRLVRALRMALALVASAGLITGCGVISFGEEAASEPLPTPSSEAEHRAQAGASLAMLHLSLPEGSSQVRWAPAPKMGAKDSNIKDAAVVSFRAPMTKALLKHLCPDSAGNLLTDDQLTAGTEITPGTFGLRPNEAESLGVASAPKDAGICDSAIWEAVEVGAWYWYVLVTPGNPTQFKILLYRYTRQ